MKIVKYLKYIFPAFLFFVVMEFFFRSFGFSHSSFFVLFAIATFSAFRITRYRYLPTILAGQLAFGSVLFFLTLGKNSFQHLYIAFSSLLFMISLIGLRRFFSREENSADAERIKLKILDSGFNLNQTAIMISFFLLASGAYGIYIDFDLPTWAIMAAIFASALLSTFYLAKINFLKSQDLDLHLDSFKNKTFVFYSFLSGFLMAELVWAASFISANHLTVGIILLLFYYAFWNILRSYLRNELSRKIILLNIFFLIVSFSVVFLTSKWSIS